MAAVTVHTLRPITDADLPFLQAVYAASRAEEMAQVDWPPEAIEAFLGDQFRLQHQHYMNHYQGTAFDVVLVDGERAGRLYVARWEREIRLVDIALMPAFRGQGLGRELMADLLAEADRVGLPLSLHVEQFNPVLGWYQRLGFREVDTHGVYFLMTRDPHLSGAKP